jgi:hypothetical protein
MGVCTFLWGHSNRIPGSLVAHRSRSKYAVIGHLLQASTQSSVVDYAPGEMGMRSVKGASGRWRRGREAAGADARPRYPEVRGRCEDGRQLLMTGSRGRVVCKAPSLFPSALCSPWSLYVELYNTVCCLSSL